MMTIDLSLKISIDDILYNDYFFELCQELGITINHEWLEKKYNLVLRNQGNVLLFTSTKTNQITLVLDTFLSATDQHNMITLGIRTNNHRIEVILALLKDISNTAPVKSDITVSKGVLDQYINTQNYPLLRHIVPDVTNPMVYEFKQRFEVF